jgi:hypothetical protein
MRLAQVIDPSKMAVVEPFNDAWMVLYLATSHLDHLQDNDPDPLVEGLNPNIAVRYNALISLFFFAQSMLSDTPCSVPHERMTRLYSLWTDSVLRMGGGQHEDLCAVADTLSLDLYQQIAQAKTGSAFTLAFGGVALLLCQHEIEIEALVAIGELYGTLIQYSDDVLDRDHGHDALSVLMVNHAPLTVLSRIRQHYFLCMENELLKLSQPIREALMGLLQEAWA